MEAMMAEHKGRAYIAKEKSWGDTNFDEEPVQSNYACALMVDTIKETLSQVSPDTCLLTTCLLMIIKRPQIN